MAVNNSFRTYNTATLNLKLSGITLNSNTANIIAKVSSGFYNPNAEVNINVNIEPPAKNIPCAAWLRATGEIAVSVATTVNDVEIRILGSYFTK